MKDAYIGHPNMERLSVALKVPLPYAVGLIEMLWQWTADYAPLGNIGRWSDEQIAGGVKWKRSPDELIQALLDCEWISRDPERRLIHRWRKYSEFSSDRKAIPAAIRAAVLAIGICARCGSRNNPTVDHIHPVSKGGSDDPGNLQCLCRTCNSRKGARS